MKFIHMVWVAYLFLLVGCATGSSVASTDTSPAQKKAGPVKKTIVCGQTPQNNIVQLLGTPNRATKNAKGETVWTYIKQTYDADSGSLGGGIVLFGGSKAVVVTKETKAYDLVLTFDGKNIVKDYAVVSSKI